MSEDDINQPPRDPDAPLYEPDEPFDAGNPQHVKKRQKEAKRTGQQLDAVIGAVMETPQGRAWIWHWLEMCGVFRSSFSNNALEMARREGERNIGLRLLADIHRVAPEHYITMSKENSKQ